jgi:hypothetical protein
MRNKKITWLIALVALIFFWGVSSVYAGDPARIGTASGEQLLVPVGARDLAMGGANIAFSSGLDAIYWNPAGLPSMNTNVAAVFSTMQIFSDINVNYLAAGIAAGKLGHLGFSIKAFDFGDIPITTNQDIDGVSGATFSPTFLTIGVTYAKRLTDVIQVGGNVKFLSESVPQASANAIAFDVGIQYHNIGNLQGVSMGLAVKNIGTNVQYGGSAFLTPADDFEAGRTDFRERPIADHQLPAAVELGLGYQRDINENNSFIVDGIFQNNNFGNDNWRVGLEYSFKDLIALRGGYVSTLDTGSDDELYSFTAGLGLHFLLGKTDITIDYAFRDSQYFDGNNMFQLQFGF